MPKLQEIIEARKVIIQQQHEETRQKEEAAVKKAEEEIIKSFSEQYPEIVSLPEFQWKPRVKFQRDFQEGAVGLAFTLGTITFEASNRTAGICKVCPKCGILKTNHWLRDEQILDYIIEHPDGNEKMSSVCDSCRREENRIKSSEPKEVPQYPTTIEEKVFAKFNEILDLLDVARND